MNPELFFPDKTDLGASNEAILTCFNCEVRKECKQYRKRTGSEHGIWGGELQKRNKA